MANYYWGWQDDIATVIAMTLIMIASVLVVVFKLTVIDEPPDPNISTFRPLDQQIGTAWKYNGNGYLPCNGNIPCQVRSYFTKIISISILT